MSDKGYICAKCGKEYKHFDSYKSHVLKAHTGSANSASVNTNKQTANTEFKCSYCNNFYISKYTLKRHIDSYCKDAYKGNHISTTTKRKNVTDENVISKQLLQVTPEIIRAVTEVVKASLGITNSQSVTNTDQSDSNNCTSIENSGQISNLTNTNIATQNNTQNNLQVNQDIHVNPLGKENLSHISKADILEMLHLGAGAVPALARAILELPENRNIAGYDKKNGKVMFVNRKGKVEIGNLDKVIGWFTEDNIGRVNNYITEYDDEFPPNDRLIHRLKVMQGHETIEDEDEEEHNRIYQTYFANCSSQLKDAIEVNSKQALLRIKKFHDFIEQNKVLGYFPPSTPNFHRLV
jgi:DNA-directed RNA polymerase subunit RPC12/RpoP